VDVALKELTGKRPVYMRPPYGNTSPAAIEWLVAQGYKIINWNVDTNDWQHVSVRPLLLFCCSFIPFFVGLFYLCMCHLQGEE
jgi:peptidoglycan/xylan/chitin deacetylase (PgdA/CDA1 family)